MAQSGAMHHGQLDQVHHSSRKYNDIHENNNTNHDDSSSKLLYSTINYIHSLRPLRNLVNVLIFFINITHLLVPVQSYTPVDIKLDEKAKQLHRIDSFNILAYTFLLILTVCTIWLFKRRRARFLHETGLAIIYGLIIGAIIRYVGDANSSFTTKKVVLVDPKPLEAPPDSVLVPLVVNDKTESGTTTVTNKTYVYIFRGQLAHHVTGEHDISQKATFDPEIFFNIILPPIIFNAGYSLKKRFFFRNIGMCVYLIRYMLPLLLFQLYSKASL